MSTTDAPMSLAAGPPHNHDSARPSGYYYKASKSATALAQRPLSCSALAGDTLAGCVRNLGASLPPISMIKLWCCNSAHALKRNPSLRCAYSTKPRPPIPSLLPFRRIQLSVMQRVVSPTRQTWGTCSWSPRSLKMVRLVSRRSLVVLAVVSAIIVDAPLARAELLPTDCLD